MALGFGLLSAQRTAGDARTWEDLYAETLSLARMLEDLGYASVWTTEHHFVDDGYMPSLLVTSSAIAAVTERIEIGTGVILAPLHHPLRLAEDAATVQVIADGRLTLGLGLGWSTVEFEAFGANMATRGASMSEILQILPRAWSGEVFRWDGDIYSTPELAVRPVPASPPQIVVGGGVDAAVRRAARYADGFFSNASPQRFAHQVAVATEEFERIGRDPDSFRWIYYAVMYPGPTDEIVESVWNQMWKYSDMEASASRSGLATHPPLDADMRVKVERRIVGGSPEAIIDTLGELRSEVGVPFDVVARSYFSDLSYARQIEIVESLATDVMPYVG